NEGWGGGMPPQPFLSGIPATWPSPSSTTNQSLPRRFAILTTAVQRSRGGRRPSGCVSQPGARSHSWMFCTAAGPGERRRGATARRTHIFTAVSSSQRCPLCCRRLPCCPRCSDVQLLYDSRDDAYHERIGSRILYWLDDLDALPVHEADPTAEGFLFAGARPIEDYRELVAPLPFVRDRPGEREPLLRLASGLQALALSDI